MAVDTAEKTFNAEDALSVLKEMRESYPWLETEAAGIREMAVLERRRLEKLNGPKLKPAALRALAEELDVIQKKMKPLDTRRKEILAELLAHWGHTGIDLIPGSPGVGDTLISILLELGLDGDVFREALTAEEWRSVSVEVPNIPKALARAREEPRMRQAVVKSLGARGLKVIITPPSSRRGKTNGAT